MGRSFNEPNLAAELQKIKDDVLSLQNAQRAGNLTILNSFPLNPYEGQVISLKGSKETAARSGALWNFRYNSQSPSAYKWEFIGGMPISVSAQPYVNTALPGGFTTVPVNGTPLLPILYSGEYWVEYQYTMSIATGAVFVPQAQRQPPGTGFIESTLSSYASLPGGTEQHTLGSSLMALASGDILKNYLNCNGAAQNTLVYYCGMKLTPVRIG